MLKVENVSKIYKSGFFKNTTLKAVDNVSFHIEKGECFGIIGESGSGKSTIGKMIIGLVNPSEGSIFINGNDIYQNKYMKKKEFHQHVQMIFQEPDGVFDPRWKIGKSMIEPYSIHFNMSKDEVMDRVIEWLEVVGLSEEHLNRYPFELSGGQLQRLAFARALSLNPDVIIADEPTSSLDVSVQAQILTMMRDIQQKYNLTILYITHDLYVAKEVCKNVAVMQKGRFVESGSSLEVFEHPKHEYTKGLINAQLPPDRTSREKIRREN